MWTQNRNQRHKFTCKIHWQLLASVVCAKVVFFFQFSGTFSCSESALLLLGKFLCSFIFSEHFYIRIYCLVMNVLSSKFKSDLKMMSWWNCWSFRHKFELQDSHLHLISLDLLKSCNIHQEYQFCKICLWGVDAF